MRSSILRSTTKASFITCFLFGLFSTNYYASVVEPSHYVDWLGSEGFGASHNCLDSKSTAKQFRDSPKRLLILDYDGTLAKFHVKREEAVPSEPLKEALQLLDKDPRTTVAIVSGRDQKFLDLHFSSYKSFFLSAEHGALLRRPNDSWSAPNVSEADQAWMNEADKIMKEVIRENPTIIKGKDAIERKTTGIVFHYRESTTALKEESNQVGLMKLKKIVDELHAKLSSLAEKYPIKSIHEQENIDTKLASVSKGPIAKGMWEEISDANFVLCLGDTVTDEHMFISLQEHKKHLQSSAELITAHVGEPKTTQAEYRIKDVQAVIDLLRSFYGLPPLSI